jgi:hypothetical protein
MRPHAAAFGPERRFHRRAALGEAPFAAARAEGQATPLEVAVAGALEERPPDG